MDKEMYEVSYAEYMKILDDEERELCIILQAHGVMGIAAHEVMSLNNILKKFYNEECIEINQIVDSLNNSQKNSNERLKLLRNRYGN